MVIERRGPHGRRRGKRLALRQLSQRARSQRQAMNRMGKRLAPESYANGTWARVQPFTVPVMPDGRTIR